MSLQDKNVVVTGGSRGLGSGLVETLVDLGAKVTVVARQSEALEAVRNQLGVGTLAADVRDGAAAHRILAEVRPDILVLNAGAKPPMAKLDQISWADFTAPWEHDVKAGLHWLQAALNLPLASGSRVFVVSSGAAVGGSPMSGGYGGAKRRPLRSVTLPATVRMMASFGRGNSAANDGAANFAQNRISTRPLRAWSRERSPMAAE
jgi:NADP-dependent 3-hydroxy acid dehydrogenase YdfG